MKTKDALVALAALAQESRLAVFRHLVEAGPQGSPVGPVADALSLPAATLSFHLKELTRANLLVGSQEGRFIRYTANFATMNALVAYLTENCCGGQPDLCCAPPQAASRSKPRKRRTA